MERFVKTTYELHMDVGQSFSIAHVSDLHDQNPEEPLRILREISPDIICITGDTFMPDKKVKVPPIRRNLGISDRVKRKTVRTVKNLSYILLGNHSADRNNSYRFLREAAVIAPIYMSTGNHDWEISEKDAEVIENAGIRFLDNADTEVSLGGRTFRVGGLSTIRDLDWFEEYRNKDGMKILLCHHPEYVLKMAEQMESFQLALCGHAHGGQMRIFGKAIYGPGQGIFPKFTKGCYSVSCGDNKKLNMIVSAGCSNTVVVPRFGNPCEVVEILISP